MKAVKRKLKNESGTSIIISLMFLLVVMMVGTVCLVAAYNNSGRATHSVTDQQEYHAVESAVNLITEDMKEAEFQLTTTYNANHIITGYTVENKNSKHGKIIASLLGESYAPGSSQGNANKKEFSLKVSESTDKTKDYSSLNVAGNITVGYEAYDPALNGTETTAGSTAIDFTVIISLWEETEVEKAAEGNKASVQKSNVTTMTFSPIIQEISKYNPVTETTTKKVRLRWMEEPMIESEDLRE